MKPPSVFIQTPSVHKFTLSWHSLISAKKIQKGSNIKCLKLSIDKKIDYIILHSEAQASAVVSIR